MDIEDIFALRIKGLLKENNLSLKRFSTILHEVDETGDAPAYRTLKGYTSKSNTKRNVGVRTLQAMSLTFKKLGVNIDETEFIRREENGTSESLTSDSITKAFQLLSMGLKDTKEAELEVFFDIFDRIGAENLLSAAKILGSADEVKTEDYLKIVRLKSGVK